MYNKEPYKEYKGLISMVYKCFGSILILGIIVLLLYLDIIPKTLSKSSEALPSIYYMNYDVANLNDSEENKIIKNGFELFKYTPKFIGPDNGNRDRCKRV